MEEKTRNFHFYASYKREGATAVIIGVTAVKQKKEGERKTDGGKEAP